MDSISGLVDSFIDHLRFERLLPKNTIVSYSRDLKKYSDFLQANSINDVRSVSREDILSFLEELFKNQKDSSISRILSTLRSFYKYLIRNEKITKNIFSNIKNPKLAKKEIDILGQEEIAVFLDRIPSSSYLQLRDRAMFELLYSCGMRVSEIVNLKLSDMDIEESLIRFIGKGNKQRITPMGDQAKTYILKYLQSARFVIEKEKKSDYVFLNKNGKRLTRQGFWKILKTYVKKFDFDKNIYPHIFRHSFATHMLEQGADLRIVQELLGHSSISTTEIYTNLDKRHIKKTYFKYHPRNKKSKGSKGSNI